MKSTKRTKSTRNTIAVLLLWLIALASTALFVRDRQVFTHLGPVYALCMIGSAITVQRAGVSR